MPQLDVNTWPPQLFWLAVTFLVLYFIISKIVIPRTGGVIEGRKNQIDSDLVAAQRFKADTDKAVAEYEKALAEARGKAHAIAKDTRDKLSAEVDKERSKLDGELAAKIAQAEKTIQAARTKALTSVTALATEIAAEIVGQLAGTKVSSADAAKAVAKAQGN
ncbi:F0F1 ATP synthase subunit B' [Nordella sp. HKS 07]|uniref:F0F1 ATP synthase subunit B family protein n=1 Tax=Nordella sp. HKS 07 TaxID=2712222 RepID=UPI0013E1503C|nr:F0F1 ATP synthase subunit B' [Nordella sp. HKS 07]QIG49188.1 F0F1 ATP synthase subunit B' [Nordella sp. HKS 07]